MDDLLDFDGRLHGLEGHATNGARPSSRSHPVFASIERGGYSSAMQPTPEQEPRSTPSAPGDPPRREVDRGWRTLRIGLVVFCVAVPVVLSPLIGRYPLDRFVVFAGLLTACIGLCCMILGALDRVMR